MLDVPPAFIVLLLCLLFIAGSTAAIVFSALGIHLYREISYRRWGKRLAKQVEEWAKESA